ncbi:LOW QUALITY PROTEIN: hypothetical protein PoB_001685700 [Plakobranchus ocellatus]|uniref:Uncharacterized protein n=1 Tax=Plakobranchus ocellatus TaxID=259542 RepID=A0AAV3Z751_9GAST|nr:LOW QUALITY PROTEIN: hypothetical protein PoB_001685700 [Plakobranchus ocellatus]
MTVWLIPHCVNCRGDHAASNKTCPKFLEEQAILRYKAENGGTFQQASKEVVVELHKTISTRTYACAVKTQLRMKPAALPKDGGRSASSAPPKGKKAQKDSPALSPQGTAESEVPAKHRAEKSKRQEASRETFNPFAPLAMDAEDTISSIWGDLSTPAPRGPPPPLWSGLPPPPNLNPLPRETPRSSAFPLASLPLHPQGPCDGVGEATQENQRLGRRAKGWSAKQQVVCDNGYRGSMEHSQFRSNFEELKLLLNRLQSAVVALQECRLGESQLPPWVYTLLLPQDGNPGGEVALLIRNGTRFLEIDLK